MSAHRPLSAEARTFRERILRQTWPTDGRVAHLTADDCAVICPVCGGTLAVHFHGLAARCSAECLSHSCPGEEIGERLGVEVLPE